MTKKKTTAAGKRKRTPKNTTKRKRRGRPQGATTRKTVHADAEPSRCPRCQSTERAGYHNTHIVAASGLLNGKPYNKVLFRRTNCTACDQHRVDRSYEFDPQLKSAAKE